MPPNRNPDVCRLCLGKEDLIWIFDGRMSDNMKDIIQITSGVEIAKTDPITQKVCGTCCQITIRMYKFRTTSIKNNKDLKTRYIQQQKSGLNKQKFQSIHPSIKMIMHKNPNIVLPEELSLKSHVGPYITISKDEVHDWFSHKNYSNEKIKRVLAEATALYGKPPSVISPKPALPLKTKSTEFLSEVNAAITSIRTETGGNASPTTCKKIKLGNGITVKPVISSSPPNIVQMENKVRVQPEANTSTDRIARRKMTVRKTTRPITYDEDIMFTTRIMGNAEQNKAVPEPPVHKGKAKAAPEPLVNKERYKIPPEPVPKQRPAPYSVQMARAQKSSTAPLDRNDQIKHIMEKVTKEVFPRDSHNLAQSLSSLASNEPVSPSSEQIKNIVEKVAKEIFANSHTFNNKSIPSVKKPEPVSPSDPVLLSRRDQKVYSCKVCNCPFTTVKDLKVHERKNHTKCAFCNKRFGSLPTLEQHVKYTCLVKHPPKDARLCLVRVDDDDELRKKYSEAFEQEVPDEDFDSDSTEIDVTSYPESLPDVNEVSVTNDKTSEGQSDKSRPNTTEVESRPVLKTVLGQTPRTTNAQTVINGIGLEGRWHSAKAVNKPTPQSEINCSDTNQRSATTEVEKAVKELEKYLTNEASAKKNAMQKSQSKDTDAKDAQGPASQESEDVILIPNRVDVICISDDEADDIAKTPLESTKPKIKIVNPDLLKNINVHDNDVNIMRQMLSEVRKAKPEQNISTMLKDNRIVDGDTNKKKILLNLRKHLQLYKVPVQIKHGEHMRVRYAEYKPQERPKKKDFWFNVRFQDLQQYQNSTTTKAPSTTTKFQGTATDQLKNLMQLQKQAQQLSHVASNATKAPTTQDASGAPAIAFNANQFASYFLVPNVPPVSNLAPLPIIQSYSTVQEPSAANSAVTAPNVSGPQPPTVVSPKAVSVIQPTFAKTHSATMSEVLTVPTSIISEVLPIASTSATTSSNSSVNPSTSAGTSAFHNYAAPSTSASAATSAIRVKNLSELS